MKGYEAQERRCTDIYYYSIIVLSQNFGVILKELNVPFINHHEDSKENKEQFNKQNVFRDDKRQKFFIVLRSPLFIFRTPRVMRVTRSAS